MGRIKKAIFAASATEGVFGCRVLVAEKTDYEGFHANPMRWETVVDKFEGLSAPYADAGLRREIIESVEGLEPLPVKDFVAPLAKVRIPD